MPVCLGLGYLVLLGRDRLGFLVHPLLGALQRRVALVLLALVMPVRTQNRLATSIDSEGTMINHPLQGVCLHLGSRSVHFRPLMRFQLRLHLWASPVHQGLAFLGLDDDTLARVPLSYRFPGALGQLRAICQGPHLGRFTALKTVRLMVIEQAKHAQPRFVEALRHGLRMYGPINDEQITSGGPSHLLTVSQNHL